MGHKIAPSLEDQDWGIREKQQRSVDAAGPPPGSPLPAPADGGPGATGPPESSLLSLTSPSAVGPGRQVRGPSASPLLQLRSLQDGHSETGGTGGCGGQSPHWAGKSTPRRAGTAVPTGPSAVPGLRCGQSPLTRGRGEPSPGALGPGPADSGTSDRGHSDNALDSGNGA